MSKPWLSVLMPIYNGNKYMCAALDSIVAQNDSEIEVVAVDDGSTDQTPDILESYKNRLNLVIHRQVNNGDWVSTQNRAMDFASGEYECWLHHDDVWEPGRARTLKDSITRWPEAVLFLRPSWFIDREGRRVGLWRCPLPRNQLLDPEYVISRLLVQNFNAAPAPTYKAHVARAVGKMDQELWWTADWDFWLRLAAAGMTVYCPEPLTGYRLHPSSLTSRRTADSVAMRRQFALVLDRYFASDAERQGAWRDAAEPARFSAFVNVELARWSAGGRISFYQLARAFLRLGLFKGHRYLRDSRIYERAWGRVRAGGLLKTRS